MKATLTELQAWVADSRITGSAAFDGVVTDSRTASAGNLFVALKGERFDAHDFLADIAAKGVSAVVAAKVPDGFAVPALIVPDTRLALGEIACNWRRRFDLPLIGVTGSNGKTTVKEMIASILASAFGDGNYLATRGNLNNDIGVPLTLFRLSAEHRAAVVELGMNHVGEIAYLSSIAQPTVGLVNNAQREHQEFMQSVRAVAEENGAVIRNLPMDGVAVFPADDAFASLWRSYAIDAGSRVVTFGLSRDADVTGDYSPTAAGSDLALRVEGKSVPLRLSVPGLHNVRNALAAAACCHAVGIGIDAIICGLERFSSVNGRLQRKTAANGAAVIDDTYNANPDSVQAAIDVLAQAASPRILVLGDMGEVGQEGVRFHREAGAHAKSSGINHFFTLGQLASHASEAFDGGAAHAENLDELMKLIKKVLTPAATVLVKGSRFMKMERVVNDLVNQDIREHG